MSRIILRLGPNRPSAADPCVVVAGNALSSLVWHTQNRQLHSLCNAAPSVAPRIRRTNSHVLHLPAPGSIARRAWPYSQVSNRRALFVWGPHPPASAHARTARLSRGRVWCAKLGLPLTSQQSLCRYIYSHNIHHLGAAPRLTTLPALFVHIGAGSPPRPFNHHSRRSPRVRLAALHVTSPSLPHRIERVWPASTRELRLSLCTADSGTSIDVFGARVLSANSPGRCGGTLRESLLMPSNSASKHDFDTPSRPTQ
jgi:hypothetical protein